jgi:non-ribosomal peptide synthetase component F
LGVSAATLFHAAWAVVMARTSGRDDVLFGSVLLGRMHGSAGAQRTLGMFINTLPLRLKLSGLTAKSLVESTQRELIDLLSHEQAPLALARRCSALPGSTPLFSALLNYRHSLPNPESATWSEELGMRAEPTTRSCCLLTIWSRRSFCEWRPTAGSILSASPAISRRP